MSEIPWARTMTQTERDQLTQDLDLLNERLADRNRYFVELARLRRVEQAAQTVVDCEDDLEDVIDELRKALES